MTTQNNINKKLLIGTLALLTAGNVFSQQEKSSVLTNSFWDNWEVAVGVEHLSFYSGREDGLNISKSPFERKRANFGAAIAFNKWFTPEFGMRTKAHGYWGKAVSYLNTKGNSKELADPKINFFSIQEHFLLNATNIILGYQPTRRWDVIPYAGLAINRNFTHGETSFGVGFGILGTYAINNQLKVHADLGGMYAGSENGKYGNGQSMMGKFHTLKMELGLTFTLGKTKWNNKVHHSAGILPITPIGDYEKLKEKEPLKDMSTTMIVTNNEVPAGMVLVNRGHVKMGITRQDSLWGFRTPVRNITVDDFWMDKTEVTNRMYKEFVKDICDSIIAQRMEDPYYGGDIERIIESLYITNPVTGEKKLDARQMVYVYEEYDYTSANKRKYRLDPRERVLNTDISIDEQKITMISKDTAYIDREGNIVRETIERPLSGDYDFLNTYIVNIYPDTTCWINDFPNSDNDIYTAYYFSSPSYLDYPVVGVTWEQANAYCAWRTERMGLTGREKFLKRFRLPTEAEWEFAARGIRQNEFPWEQEVAGDGKGMFFANFMPDDGDFTKDGNIITSKVGTYQPNSNGLYDMAGNVAEWTSTAYTAAGVQNMNNINPQLKYNAAIEDPYRLKRKSVRGGSWKDSESHIQSAWRSAEYQNQPRSYIGFRCVQSIPMKPTEKSILIKKNSKHNK